MNPWWCGHLETTAPDSTGFVICLACFQPLRRPMTLEELLRQIKGQI